MRLTIGKQDTLFLEGVSEIVDRYDGYLVDIWGVLHDSAKTYPGVKTCLKRLKELGKRIVIISNAARRSSVLERELAGFGILHEMYDHVATSGELFWRRFFSGEDPHLTTLGNSYYLFGSASYRLTEGLPIQQSASLEDADFVLTIGVVGPSPTVEEKEGELKAAASKGLPMICANPDIQVVRDGTMSIAAGALAKRYEELGGQVIYYGKPHRAIYDFSLELLGEVERKRILAVGDALITDVAGAGNHSLDSLLIGTGIHRDAVERIPDDPSLVIRLCESEKQIPTLMAKGFTW